MNEHMAPAAGQRPWQAVGIADGEHGYAHLFFRDKGHSVTGGISGMERPYGDQPRHQGKHGRKLQGEGSRFFVGAVYPVQDNARPYIIGIFAGVIYQSVA